jgi:serine/threonine protein kinase
MGNEEASPLGDVGSRYRIVGSLGKGGGGETFEAIRIADDARVALKCLVVAQTRDWKTVELFEREARVLASLTHPAIPRYEDSFVVESEKGTSLYLVHQFAPGVSLRQWLERGWHPDEAEILRITEFLLDVLTYLHSLSPPVVHRDIKPDNIIRSEDGRLWLVDFGAVRDFTTTMSGGSTVVGTYGYMAPEQFRGQAIPASDIYGVAATILFLLTGRPPTELPQEKLKVVFRPYVQTASPRLLAWLDRALEPAPEDRFPTTAIALQWLRNGPPARPAPPPPSRKRLGVLVAALVAIVGAGAVFVGVTELREKRAKAALVSRQLQGPLPRLPHRLDGEVVIVHPQRLFQGHMALILNIAISPDDKTLATGSDVSCGRRATPTER